MKKIFIKLCTLIASVILLASCNFGGQQKGFVSFGSASYSFPGSIKPIVIKNARVAVPDKEDYENALSELRYSLSGTYGTETRSFMQSPVTADELSAWSGELKQGLWIFTLTAGVENDDGIFVPVYSGICEANIGVSPVKLDFAMVAAENGGCTGILNISLEPELLPDEYNYFVEIINVADGEVVDTIAFEKDLSEWGMVYLLPISTTLDEGSYNVFWKREKIEEPSVEITIRRERVFIKALTETNIEFFEFEQSNPTSLKVNIGKNITANSLGVTAEVIKGLFERELNYSYTSRMGLNASFVLNEEDEIYSLTVVYGGVNWSFDNWKDFYDVYNVYKEAPFTDAQFEEYAAILGEKSPDSVWYHPYNKDTGFVELGDSESNSLFLPLFPDKYVQSFYYDSAFTKPVELQFRGVCSNDVDTLDQVSSIYYAGQPAVGNTSRAIYVKYNDSYSVELDLGDMEIDPEQFSFIDRDNDTYSYAALKSASYYCDVDFEDNVLKFTNVRGVFKIPNLISAIDSHYYVTIKDSQNNVFEPMEEEYGEWSWNPPLVNGEWSVSGEDLVYTINLVPKQYNIQYTNRGSYLGRQSFTYGDASVELPDYSEFSDEIYFDYYHFYAWYVGDYYTFRNGNDSFKTDFEGFYYEEDKIYKAGEFLDSSVLTDHLYLYSLWEPNGSYEANLYYYLNNDKTLEKKIVETGNILPVGTKVYASLVVSADNYVLTGDGEQTAVFEFSRVNNYVSQEYDPFILVPNDEGSCFEITEDWVDDHEWRLKFNKDYKVTSNNLEFKPEATIDVSFKVSESTVGNTSVNFETIEDCLTGDILYLVDGKIAPLNNAYIPFPVEQTIYIRVPLSDAKDYLSELYDAYLGYVVMVNNNKVSEGYFDPYDPDENDDEFTSSLNYDPGLGYDFGTNYIEINFYYQELVNGEWVNKVCYIADASFYITQ